MLLSGHGGSGSLRTQAERILEQLHGVLQAGVARVHLRLHVGQILDGLIYAGQVRAGFENVPHFARRVGRLSSRGNPLESSLFGGVQLVLHVLDRRDELFVSCV